MKTNKSIQAKALKIHREIEKLIPQISGRQNYKNTTVLIGASAILRLIGEYGMGEIKKAS